MGYRVSAEIPNEAVSPVDADLDPTAEHRGGETDRRQHLSVRCRLRLDKLDRSKRVRTFGANERLPSAAAIVHYVSVFAVSLMPLERAAESSIGPGLQ